jgi:hypothetical protein
MGFLDVIIRDWGNKSYTPQFKTRVEKARQNWVTQKSRPLTAMADRGSLTGSELASQMLALESLSHRMVKRALRRRTQADPLKGGGVVRLPRKTDDSQ